MPLRFTTVCSITAILCLALAVVWAWRPAPLLAFWSIDVTPSATFVGRRCAALFLGWAWLMRALGRAPPSIWRTGVADAFAVACAALAVAGIVEWLAGTAGAGILTAVAVEATLAAALVRTVRTDGLHAGVTARPSAPPEGSAIAALVDGADFHDAWTVCGADASLDALGLYRAAARAAPRWIDLAMVLRNRVVAPFGLKDLGRLSAVDADDRATPPRAGDRIGIFTLQSVGADEILLGDRDAHLDVVVSVHRRVSSRTGQAIVTVTTVVRVHNLLGRLYMVPVRPAHRVVVRALLDGIGKG